MGLFDGERLDELERADKYKSAKIFIQEVRLRAIETGQPPQAAAVLKKVKGHMRHDPYCAILLDYAIELLEGPKPTIPEDALP